VAGTKDPEVLADLARASCARSCPRPSELEAPHREVLDTIGALIERAETRA